MTKEDLKAQYLNAFEVISNLPNNIEYQNTLEEFVKDVLTMADEYIEEIEKDLR